EDYQRLLDARGVTCSMSRRGNCYDNAVMEAFFSTLKAELADRFDSCSDAKMELFDYIEAFSNQRRRHSTLGQLSPAEFEKRGRTACGSCGNCTERSLPRDPHASSFPSEKNNRRKEIDLRQSSTQPDQGQSSAGGSDGVACSCVSLLSNAQCVQFRLERAQIDYVGQSTFIAHDVVPRSPLAHLDDAFASASCFRKAASPAADTSTHFWSGEASAP